MLELSKKILFRVSFDAILFQKELKKAISWLTDRDELLRLKEWCQAEFGTKYPSILRVAFPS